MQAVALHLYLKQNRPLSTLIVYLAKVDDCLMGLTYEKQKSFLQVTASNSLEELWSLLKLSAGIIPSLPINRRLFDKQKMD